MAYNDNRNMWISVDGGWSGWFRTPKRGADMSPQGWAVDGTLLSGGGYAHGSWGSHKRYSFEWPQSSSQADAQFIKSLSDGTYGRGLIHFITPDIMRLNILPARVADPSMAVGDEGASLIYGLEPNGVPTTSAAVNNLPYISAQYGLSNVTPGYRGEEESLYIPIPEGYSLGLLAFHSVTGSGGIFYSPVTSNWATSAPVQLPRISNDAGFPALQMIPKNGGQGVRLWVGRSANTASTVTIAGMFACLISDTDPLPSVPGTGYGDLPYGEGPYGGYTGLFTLANGWMGGMGNSGCRFQGKPTLEVNGHFDGKYRVGFAASFVEVGSWVSG